MPAFGAGTTSAATGQAMALWAVFAMALPFALPGLPGAPGRDNVQQAYEAAKAETGARHQDDLQIREAYCSPDADHRFACQIDFVRTAEPNGRLYFTVVTIEKRGAAWALIGGLCRSAG